VATINGTNGDDTLDGTQVADTLNGRGGNDVLNGRGGDDRLNGGAGDDTMVGGAGYDRYFVQSRGDVVSEGTDGGVDTVIVNVPGQDAYFLPENVENAAVTGFFRIVGNDLDNELRVGKGGVVVQGMGGNDVLVGDAHKQSFSFAPDQYAVGYDVVDGGGGEDILSVGGSSSVIIDFQDGVAVGHTALGQWSVQFTNIRMALAGTGDDLLIADDSGLTFNGMAGNDTLRGGGGADRLLGDIGNDTVTGGGGKDYVSGSRGVDHLDGGGGNDVLAWWGGEDARVNGGSGTDTLEQGPFYAPDIDLTAVPDRVIRNIEQIDMRGAGGGTVTLGERDLLAISSTTDRLKIFGEAGDTVDVVGHFSFRGSSGGFDRYKVGAGTLIVDSDITVV
jgi:Ca2+-binding RTX toxin-like protein